MAIGRSSNLAQIALTYTYNFEDEKYDEYACILAVLAQIAIDNAKRKFDVDLPSEIERINNELAIDQNGLPKFWLITKKDKRKAPTVKEKLKRQRTVKNKIKEKINPDLKCPMNYLYNIELGYERNTASTLPMDYFFINHEMNEHRRKSKKVEELIESYSLNLYNLRIDNMDDNWDEDKDGLILLRSDFDELIHDIQGIYISKNYAGMMCWLINRAFCIGAGAKSKEHVMNSKTDKNKALLMKVLYSVNPEVFLNCFKIGEKVDND